MINVPRTALTVAFQQHKVRIDRNKPVGGAAKFDVFITRIQRFHWIDHDFI